MRCRGRAINSDLPLEAMLLTASAACQIKLTTVESAQRAELRAIWSNACSEVQVEF